MTNRKFHKTVWQVEILSEEPIPEHLNLGEIYHEMINGDFSGKVEEVSHKTLNGKAAAEALIAQGSDPEFFRIDEDGNDVE